MRIAAGVLLLIVAVAVVAGMIIDVIGHMSDFGSRAGSASILLAIVPIPIILGSLLIAGGVLCFRRRHWGVCLVSALITLCFWIIPAVAPLAGGGFSTMMWRVWIVLGGAIISTIFIAVSKKDWKEFSDSVDGKVSYDG